MWYCKADHESWIGYGVTGIYTWIHPPAQYMGFSYHWTSALAPLRELWLTPIQDSPWNNQISSLICFSWNRGTFFPSSWIHIYPTKATETRWNDHLTHPPSSQCRYMSYIYLHRSQRLFIIFPLCAHSEMHLDIQFDIPWSYISLPISQKEEMFEEKEWKYPVWMVQPWYQVSVRPGFVRCVVTDLRSLSPSVTEESCREKRLSPED